MSNIVSYAATLKPEIFHQNFQITLIRQHPKQALLLLQQASLNNLSTLEQYFHCYNLSYALFRSNKKRQVITQLDQCLQLTQKLPSYYGAKTHLLKATSYGILWRDNEQAIAELLTAKQLASSAKHKDLMQLKLDITGALTQAYNQQGNLIKASEYAQQAVKLAEQSNITAEIIYNHVLAGRIAVQQSLYNQAYSHYQRALSFTDENTPIRTKASIALRLASVFTAQHNFQQAINQAKKAVAGYSQTPNKRMQVKSLRVLGEAYLRVGDDVNTALMHFLNAQEIAKSLDDQLNLGQIQHLIASSYCQLEQFDNCRLYADLADKALTKAKSHFYWGYNQLVKAKIFDHAKQTDEAISLLEQTLQRSDIQPYPELTKSLKQTLVQLYSKTHNYKAALAMQQSIVKANEDLSSTSPEAQQLTQLVAQKQLLSELEQQANSKALLETQLSDIKLYFYLLLAIVGLCLIYIGYLLKQHKVKQLQLAKKYQYYQLNWQGFVKQLAKAQQTHTGQFIVIHFNQTISNLALLEAQHQLITLLKKQHEKLCFTCLDHSLLVVLPSKQSTSYFQTITNDNITSLVIIDIADIPARFSDNVLACLFQASLFTLEPNQQNTMPIFSLKLQNNAFAQLSYPITSEQGLESLKQAFQLGLFTIH